MICTERRDDGHDIAPRCEGRTIDFGSIGKGSTPLGAAKTSLMKIAQGKKKNKYNAKKVIIDGIRFDSEKEGKRYVVLKKAQEEGIISDLELQPRYVILPAIKDTRTKHFKRKPDEIEEYTIQQPVRYTADFRYIKDGKIVVEDVKGSKYTISRDLPLRLRLMRYFHNIKVRIVYEHDEEI